MSSYDENGGPRYSVAKRIPANRCVDTKLHKILFPTQHVFFDRKQNAQQQRY